MSTSISSLALELARTCQELGPVLGPLYYIAFLSLWVVLCLPCSPIEPLPGFVFGLKTGAFCSLMGKLIGSAIAMYLGRYVFKKPTENFVHQRFPRIRKLGLAIEKEGFPLLVFIRAMWLPIALKNYGLAILNVSIPHVLFAGLLTSIPHSLLFAYVGTKMNSLAELNNKESNSLTLWHILCGENNEELPLLLLVGLPLVVGCVVVFRNFYLRFQDLLRGEEEKE